MSLIFIYTTFPDKDEAVRIARILLTQKQVACANVMPAYEALYRWEGAIQTASEVAVVFKTTAALYEQVETVIRAEHSYECPCIAAWPIETGYPPFLQWAAAQVE